MSNDVLFADGAERAARALHAAVFAALTQGLSDEDVDRITAEAKAAAGQLSITAASQARLRAIGYVPSGAQLPPPPLQLVRGNENPGGFAGMKVPVLHPGTAHIAAAANDRRAA